MKKLFLIFFSVLGMMTAVQAMDNMHNLDDVLKESTDQVVNNIKNIGVFQAMNILSKAGVLDDIINIIQNEFFLTKHREELLFDRSLVRRFGSVYSSRGIIQIKERCVTQADSFLTGNFLQDSKRQQFDEQYIHQVATDFPGFSIVPQATINIAYVNSKEEIVSAYFVFKPWFIRKCCQLYAWMKSVKPQIRFANQVNQHVCLLILHTALLDCLTLCDHAIMLLMKTGNFTQESIRECKTSIVYFGVMLSMGYYTQELEEFAPSFVKAKRNLRKCPSNLMNNQSKEFNERYHFLKGAYEYVFDLALQELD